MRFKEVVPVLIFAKHRRIRSWSDIVAIAASIG